MGQKLKSFWQNYLEYNVFFHVLSFISIALIIASFCVPPVGIINQSVLAAVGEIFAFGALGAVLKAIDKGVDAKVKHGNTEIGIENPCNSADAK